MGTVTAGGNPSYTIAGGGSGFSINPQTGAITVTGTNIMGSQALLIQAVGASTSSYATAVVSCGQALVIPSQPAPSFGSFPMQNPPVIGPAPSTSYGQSYSGSQYPMNNNIHLMDPVAATHMRNQLPFRLEWFLTSQNIISLSGARQGTPLQEWESLR